MKTSDNVLKLKAVMEYYRLTQTEMSARTGIPQTNISEMLRGKRGCGNSNIAKIGNAFPKINPLWLIGLSEEMFKASTPPIMQNNVNGDNNYNHGGCMPVRCDNCDGAASTPALITTKDNSMAMECPSCGTVIEVPDTAILPLVPPEIAKKPDLNLESFRNNCPQQMEEVDLRQVWGKGVFLMRVDTRAMEPEYREGTFLVLRRLKDLSYARPDGSAYVIDTMRPHTLFRYLSKERDGTYVLNADNDKRGPMYLNAADIINIYDIVGSFRIGR